MERVVCEKLTTYLSPCSSYAKLLILGGAAVVGPLKSLAWLAGLDELVEAIDSEAFTIQDNLEVVPLGAGLMWPVERYVELGKISSEIAKRVFHGDPPYPTTTNRLAVARDQCPAGITNQPAPFPLRDISGASRLQTPSGSILCARMKSHKKLETLEREINQMVGGGFNAGNFWFRGLTVEGLKSTLAFFVPHISGNNRDNEFGPGFYTGKDLRYSLCYLNGGVGAIMVFRNPALRNTSIWEPNLEDWQAWVTIWLSRPLAIANRPVPPAYDRADFILGPIREAESDSGNARRQVPRQSNQIQLVAVSYKGCQTLADALHMIIFVEPSS